MKLLSLDTSTSQGSVAVLVDGQILSSQQWNRERSHSELVTVGIERCLLDAGLKPQDLTHLAVGRGPGSFTGIRVAINAARTLAYALHLSTFAFTTNDILSAAVSKDISPLPTLTLVNAHKNLLFAQSKNVALGAYSIEELDQCIQMPHLCLGDGYLEYEKLFPPGLKSRLHRNEIVSDFPSARTIARLAFEKYSTDPGGSPESQPLDWKALQALYIRASGAEEKIRES